MKTDFFKFKKDGKTGIKVPDKISLKFGITEVAEPGIFGFGKEYNKLFLVAGTSKNVADEDERIKGSMMVLRSMGISFSYYEAGDSIYLYLGVRESTIIKAKMILDEAEDKLKTSLYTFGIVIKLLCVNERFKLIEKSFAEDMDLRMSGVEEYLKDTSWADSFDFKLIDEKDLCISRKEFERSYMYVRQIATENIGALYTTIKKNKQVESIILDFEPMSNEEVYRKMTDIYDDVPKEWFGERVTQTGDVASMQKYIMAGIYFCIIGNSEETDRLLADIKGYGCEAVPYIHRQRAACMSFGIGNVAYVRETRVVLVKDAVRLNPFCVIEDDDNALLKAFDKMFG